MLVPSPPTPVSAISLETDPPEIAAPDLTEFRIVKRSFPKDPAERDCYRFLLGEMQAAPDHPRRTRVEIEDTCRRKFSVTVESFHYIWREAIKVTGARWDQPGRRPRKKLTP
jgi:hypothetical protein